MSDAEDARARMEAELNARGIRTRVDITGGDWRGEFATGWRRFWGTMNYSLWVNIGFVVALMVFNVVGALAAEVFWDVYRWLR